jgi:hypothetical protein
MIALPHDRVRLKTVLAQAGISKNTYFRLYRYNPDVARLLDIQEDRDHHLHFAADAGQRLREYRGKAPHGNIGRAPTRPCPSCGETLHPRHTACVECGFDLAPSSGESTPKRSTAMTNFKRAEELRRLRGE